MISRNADSHLAAEQNVDPAAREFRIMGVRINALDVPLTVRIIDSWIRRKQREYVVLTGAHGVIEMQDDPELRRINNEAGLTTPDGMSVVWVGRQKGFAETRKTYAPDLMLATFEAGVEKGWRHYLYGGTEGVAGRLAAAMQQKFPGVIICGTYTPGFTPLTPIETEEITAAIEAAAPDIVWCGLGCPKQERWMAKFRPRLSAPVLIGVGAGFDFLSGTKTVAPRWISLSGFEWLYRTVQEPRRLAKRYLRVVPRFIAGAVREVIRGTSARVES
jgi:N-acetylglucosaminyldiphosphoundecaprenol N-acetyl-beta-D-mannosaminyltransferase